MRKCETLDCEEVPYSNSAGIFDRFCTSCSLIAYYSSKPYNHDFGD